MTHIPTLLALSALFAQPADSAPAPSDAPPQGAPANMADQAIEKAAEKIDSLEFLSARVRQSIRAGGKVVLSEGVYRRGPDHRSYFELNVDLGKSVGRRIHASDGKTGIIYEKLLDTETLQTFLVSEVVPLMDSRVMSPEVRRNLLLRLPFAAPGEMLRGLLESMTFSPPKEGTIGIEPERAVLVYEGTWKEAALPIVAQNGNVRKLEELGGSTPQHVRLYLDKETEFPLKLELFRRDSKAEYKPIYTLEFLEVNNAKIADAEFTFVPPEKVVPVDVTTQLVASLSTLPAKEKTTDDAPAGGQKLEESLAPAGK